jgi:hypothetical protein
VLLKGRGAFLWKEYMMAGVSAASLDYEVESYAKENRMREENQTLNIVEPHSDFFYMGEINYYFVKAIINFCFIIFTFSFFFLKAT